MHQSGLAAPQVLAVLVAPEFPLFAGDLSSSLTIDAGVLTPPTLGSTVDIPGLLIYIVPENPPINVSLAVGDLPAMWRPIAKDGADLPLGQREPCPAQLTIAVRETYDFEFSPEKPGELALEVVRPSNRFLAQITPSHKIVELRPESRVAAKIPVLN